jgi:hypothetical protein
MHLGEHCQLVPPEVLAELGRLRDRKSNDWADGVQVLGVYKDGVGLRFDPNWSSLSLDPCNNN